MRDLRPPKKTLRPIPKLPFLRNQPKASSGPVITGDAPVPPQSNASPASTVGPLGPLGRIIIGAGGTALFFTCVYSAYGPASVGDMTATVVMLLSGWVFAVGAFTLSEVLTSLPNRHRFLASFSFAIVLAAITAWWGTTIFHNPSPPTSLQSKTGARLFFRIGGFTKTEKKIEAGVSNKGDVMARIGSINSSRYVVVDHVLSENEEELQYQLALKELPPIRGGVEVPSNTERSFGIEINFTDTDYDNIIKGTHYFYLFSIVRFRDELTPIGKANLASVCTHFNKNTTTALSCVNHTESRLED